MTVKSYEERNDCINRAFEELEEERRITRNNLTDDIWKMSNALSEIKDMSIEGNLVREDLLGLLEFEALNVHNIDSLLIERRKEKSFFDPSYEKIQ